jgi:hypothetical protein
MAGAYGQTVKKRKTKKKIEEEKRVAAIVTEPIYTRVRRFPKSRRQITMVNKCVSLRGTKGEREPVGYSSRET